MSKRPKKIFIFLQYAFLKIDNKMFHLSSDKFYIRTKYKYMFGKDLDLSCPKTFNEKMQWLKLYDRNPEYTKMVDKYEAKKYVASIIGEEYIIPTLGIYDKFDDINFDKLPNQFVIKCTHDSGGLVIVKNKNKIDKKIIKKDVNKSLKRNYYYLGREWPYKNVIPKIIVEKYMEDEQLGGMIDYKFFCFNGEPRIILVCSDRFGSSGMKETWFDINWNLLPLTEGGHDIDIAVKKPKRLNEMKEKAMKLAKDIPFVRIDFYELHKMVYFGEMTFYPASGFERFSPEEWDRKFGDMIELPKMMEVNKNDK